CLRPISDDFMSQTSPRFDRQAGRFRVEVERHGARKKIPALTTPTPPLERVQGVAAVPATEPVEITADRASHDDRRSAQTGPTSGPPGGVRLHRRSRGGRDLSAAFPGGVPEGR